MNDLSFENTLHKPLVVAATGKDAVARIVGLVIQSSAKVECKINTLIATRLDIEQFADCKKSPQPIFRQRLQTLCAAANAPGTKLKSAKKLAAALAEFDGFAKLRSTLAHSEWLGQVNFENEQAAILANASSECHVRGRFVQIYTEKELSSLSRDISIAANRLCQLIDLQLI